VTFSPPDTAMEPMLSISNGKPKPGSVIAISLRMPRVVMTFLAVSDAAIYSVSVVDRETPPCLIER
jgi:hypothetical protein